MRPRRDPQHEHDHDDADDEALASITTREGWADAAAFTMSDINMLRRELVIGYLVAGFLTVLVPMEWWNKVFFQGHGFWTTLENVLIGPFIAVITFVCSIGNVPMAAALWHGGIGFGGVIASSSPTSSRSRCCSSTGSTTAPRSRCGCS